MEVWIILAATGSSYFVNLWQKNVHKEEDASSSSSSLLLFHPKEGEEEEEEKLKHHSSSYNTMPMHLRYRRFSPSPTSIHHPLGIEFSIPRAFNKATEKHPFPPEVVEETEPRNLRISSTASRPFLTQIATRPTDIAHIFDPESPLIEDGEEMPAVTLGTEMTSSLLNRGENEALLHSKGLKTATTMSSDGGNTRRKNRVLEEDKNNLNEPLLHSKGLKTATTVFSDGRNNKRKNRVHEEDKNNLELETLLHESSGLLPGVLFNFGVGVGMMFAIISSQKEVKRVAEMPGQMESSLKTLEARESELSGAADKTVDAKNGMVEGEKLASTYSISNKVMSLAESITGITHSETEEKSLGDMPTLEAELEAELERMELNIHPPNVSKHRGSCELHEVDTDTVISGELSVEGLPLMIEVEESESSSEEELPVPNYGISPRELEKRLNQVLLYRHERRIAELEAELDSMANKLQIKEEELLSWREYTQNLQGIKTQNPLDECCSGVKEDLIKESLEEGFRRDWPIPEQALKEKESVIDAKNLKKAPAFITLAGEALDAYNEACDEFLKVLSDSEESTSTLPDSSCAKMPIRRKESYISVNNGQLEEDPWEDRDLLSYVEDFTRGVVMNPVESLVLNKGGDTSDDCSSKEIISNHHLNDIGTSGSTPCSIKFIDSNTIEAYRRDLVSPYDDDTNGHSPLLPSRNRPHHFKGSSSTSGASSATTTTVASVRSKYFESGNLGSDECEEDDSDFDEKMGNLLIKRIVEKTRKGSPIVHEAQTILASLETAETPLDWNSTTLKMPWH